MENLEFMDLEILSEGQLSEVEGGMWFPSFDNWLMFDWYDIVSESGKGSFYA